MCAAVAATLVLAGCIGGEPDERGRSQRGPGPATAYSYAPAPNVTAGPLDREVERQLPRLTTALLSGALDRGALKEVASSGDARLGWLLSDVLRFTRLGPAQAALVSAFERLTGVDISDDPAFGDSPWRSLTNHLIAWDLPAPPGYREHKARLFLALEPRWEPFFADRDSGIDWRLVSWGGVLIDDRPAGESAPCLRGCIPALDDPA